MIQILTSEMAILLYEVGSIVVLLIANFVLSKKIKNIKKENTWKEEQNEIKQAKEVIANK